MTLEGVVFIWGENENPASPAPPPTVSVSAWPFLFDQPWLRWRPFADAVPDAARNANVAFVNLFHTSDSRHIEELKQVNPGCYCVAMPDPSLDMVLAHPDWVNMHYQMALADAIGGRTQADCRVYGTLLNKPVYYLPSPIGPTEWFAQFRGLPKGDYLLTLDHAFAPANTYYNVAAVAAIQRETGIRVLYAAERPWTHEYARLAGLKCEFLGRVPFQEFVDLTARARLCVDMYASHSYGRQQVLCGMVGTHCTGSEWCENAPGWSINPTNPYAAVSRAQALLDQHPRAQLEIQLTENRYGFEISRIRLEAILKAAEAEGVRV